MLTTEAEDRVRWRHFVERMRREYQPMSDQFLRKITLVLVQGNFLEIPTALRSRRIFRRSCSATCRSSSVYQADITTPNTAVIRIFNLADATSHRILNEFSRVVLNAGYENGNFGVIFDGTIKEVRRGKLDGKTKFCDIYASDSDLAYNFGVVSAALTAAQTATVNQINVLAAPSPSPAPA